MHRTLGIAVLLLALAGCESAATPLPAALLPTATPPSATLISSLRYALSPAAFAYWQSELPTGAVQFQSGVDDPSQMDVLVALGNVPGLSLAPVSLFVGLRLDVGAPPLDDPDLANLVGQAFQPPMIAASLADLGAVPLNTEPADGVVSPTALRAAFANAGYPDGLPLTLAAHMPEDGRLAQIVQPYGIDLRLVNPAASSSMGTVHGEIMAQTTQQFGEGWFPLIQMPISVRLREGLNVRYSESGLPRIGE